MAILDCCAFRRSVLLSYHCYCCNEIVGRKIPIALQCTVEIAGALPYPF